MKIFATVAVTINEIGKVGIKDTESLALYDLEDEARAGVKEALASGDKMVAMFELVGVYQIASMKLREIK